MPKQNRPQLNSVLNIVNTGQVRPFVQDFPSALSASEYYGLINMTDSFGMTRTESDVIELPSDDERNEWIKVGEIVRSTERSSSSFTQLIDQGLTEIWDQWLKNNSEFNLFLLVGDSAAPQDFTQWNSAFLLANARVTEVLRGENANPQTAADNNTMVLNGTFNYWDMYEIGQVNLIDLSGATVTRNILDVDIIYGKRKQYSEIFGITTNVATTSPSAVVYARTDKTTSVSQTDITALGTDGLLKACAVVGSYFIGLRNDGTLGHVYSTLDDIRLGNDNFTQVTTGYVALSGGNALYPANSANIFIAANAGYIYKLTSAYANPVVLHAGSLTVQNLNSIHGFGRQLVAVGASSAILVSNDYGTSWATATAPTAGLTINTVQVVAKDAWFIGTSTGVLYYTDDAGVTWTQIPLAGTVTSIKEITFYVKNGKSYFGYLIASDGTNSLIYRTINSGNLWSKYPPFVANTETVFTGVTSPAGLAVLNQNEIAVVGGTVLGFGIN